MTDKDILLAKKCLDIAQKAGAQKARVTLNTSAMDLVATLDGKIDKVTHCLDNSMSIALFANDRYGSFSTNKLSEPELKSFIEKAISMVSILTEDKCRTLPKIERTAKDARDGKEMELYDPEYESIDQNWRKEISLKACVYGKDTGIPGCKIVSEEGEYSDSIYETLIVDTNGCFCRHVETVFEYGSEITVQDKKGNRYSGYWWDSRSHKKDLDIMSCGTKALEYALAQIGQKPVKSGKYNMVVESDVASKLVNPILNALNGYSLQQGNSFLNNSLDKKIFNEGLSICDKPHIKGEIGSRLFDTEGVASKDAPVIDHGVVKQYFLNSYISGKMGMAPTIEEAIRPMVCAWPKPSLSKEDIMKMCRSGILVTGFNGGNCALANGDFSYGVQGLLFKNGKIVKPVSEMLITGNIVSLWNNLIACGSDFRPCQSKLIPTLAFADVDFNG